MFLYLAKQQEPCFSKQQLNSIVLPFCVLLDSVFSVVKSIISFDLAHTLLLIPRYDFGIHDWKHFKETWPRAPGGGETKHVLTIITMSIQVCPLPLLLLQLLWYTFVLVGVLLLKASTVRLCCNHSHLLNNNFSPIFILHLLNHWHLKWQFTQNWKFSHYLLTPTPMESLVKFLRPKNISGA